MDKKKSNMLRIITGIVFIITGIIMLLSPAGTLISIWLLMSAATIIAGALYIMAYVKEKHLYARPGLLLAEGIVDLLVGIIFLIASSAAPVIIPWVLAFWLILIGLRRVFFALDLKNADVASWKKVMLTGAIAVVLGIIVLLVPAVGAIYLVVMLAAFLIYFGVMVLLERYCHSSPHGSIF
mgnify:CR=1 FL=1